MVIYRGIFLALAPGQRRDPFFRRFRRNRRRPPRRCRRVRALEGPASDRGLIRFGIWAAGPKSWSQFYKTFYGCKLRIFIIS